MDENVSRILSLINYKPKRNKIFMKPNVANIRKAKTGVITHPRVVEALLKYFKEYEVVIGEGSIIGKNTKNVFEKTGYKRLADRYGARLVDLNEATRVEVKWKFGTIKIPSILRTHEYVNIPTMKTHVVTKVTIGLKNQKGLLEPSDKKRFHRLGLHKPIREFANVVKPALTVVDGITCVEGDGPGLSGKAKRVNLLIAGTKMVEVDNVCCQIMGFDVSEVEHIPGAHSYDVRGMTINEAKKPFKRARPYHRRFNVFYHPFDGCSGCINSVGEGVRSIRSPVKLVRFLYWGVVRRLDFVAGSNPVIPGGAGRVLCVGDCAADFAQRNGLRLIKGCPPKPSALEATI